VATTGLSAVAFQLYLLEPTGRSGAREKPVSVMGTARGNLSDRCGSSAFFAAFGFSFH
jgi:hypothetical protein